MTLEQLRIFVAVAEREHMTRAADALNLTQSATSAAIAALEARYAIRLFDRVGRSIKLTHVGKQFVVEARAVLARSAAAESVLADFAGLKRGSLSLAASQTVGNYWLPPLIHRFHSLYPGIALDLTIGNTDQVAARVRDGMADLGFVEGQIDDPVLFVKLIAEDELVLAVGAKHPWASLRTVKPAQMKGAAWIAREKGSGTRQIFETVLAGFGLTRSDINIALELPSNESVRSAVAAGAGATILSKLVAANLLTSHTLTALKIALPSRRFFLLRHKERHVTQAERELEKMIAENSSKPQSRSRT
ncbi:LysR substrate-binding domain-containing protein [Nitrobacter sp. NHB1]|uniref:LysR family transcriptional regulator n=1 Tax=Nitrobacter sp. NHB1 TaxID=3119830 RepID=UPI002FFF56F6